MKTKKIAGLAIIGLFVVMAIGVSFTPQGLDPGGGGTVSITMDNEELTPTTSSATADINTPTPKLESSVTTESTENWLYMTSADFAAVNTANSDVVATAQLEAATLNTASTAKNTVAVLTPSPRFVRGELATATAINNSTTVVALMLSLGAPTSGDTRIGISTAIANNSAQNAAAENQAVNTTTSLKARPVASLTTFTEAPESGDFRQASMVDVTVTGVRALNTA